MDPNTILHALLTKHGLDVVPYNGWLTANGRPSAITASVYRKPDWHPSLLQLDLRLLTPDGRTLTESFTGIGADHEAALRSGLDALCQSSLHVLLSTFWDAPADEQVQIETWSTTIGDRRAVIGGSVQRGKPFQVPEALFPTIEAALGERASEPLHWLRIFRSGDGPSITTEALLDNEDWPELREAIAALPWPSTEDYSSVRLFLTLSDPTSMRGEST